MRQDFLIVVADLIYINASPQPALGHHQWETHTYAEKGRQRGRERETERETEGWGGTERKAGERER